MYALLGCGSNYVGLVTVTGAWKELVYVKPELRGAFQIGLHGWGLLELNCVQLVMRSFQQPILWTGLFISVCVCMYVCMCACVYVPYCSDFKADK